MARLAIPSRSDDSDDEEFPDLDEVLRGIGAGRSKSEETTEKCDGELGKSRRVGRTKTQIGSGADKEGEKAKSRKSSKERIQDTPRRRMRVLKAKTENPLLRPLGRTGRDGEGKGSVGGEGKFDVEMRRERRVGTRDGTEKMEGRKEARLVLGKRDSLDGERVSGLEDEVGCKCTLSEGSGKRDRNENIGTVEPATARLVNGRAGKSLRERNCQLRGELSAKGSEESALNKPSQDISNVDRSKQSQGKILDTRNYTRKSDTQEFENATSEPPKAAVLNRSRRKPSTKRNTTSQSQPEPEDSEDELESDSGGLSDFIVNDSSDSDEEENVVLEQAVPRSSRRLVRGRRRIVEDSESEGELELKMGKLNMNEGFVSEVEGTPSRSSQKPIVDRSKDETPPRHESRTIWPFRLKEKEGNKENFPDESQDMADPFTLRYSPSENKTPKVSSATPPGSPSLGPQGLRSPKKLPRIPNTPHRPSMDTFWQQDVINAWNDEFSPKKTPKPTIKIDLTDDESSSISKASPRKRSPKKQNPTDLAVKKAFSIKREALAQAFLLELDNTITNGQVSHLTSSTGGIKIIWNKRLQSVAGRAHWKLVRPKPSSLNSTHSNSTETRTQTPIQHGSIELATKIITDEYRLYNTLAHEFCHLATFIISKQTKNPHGKEFKSWGAKCERAFAHRGVKVTTKHSYDIEYRFVWECENCGCQFQRHSRSLDPVRHRCGRCKGLLVQVLPVPKVVGGGDGGGDGVGVGGKKKLREYQAFVRDNLRVVREELLGSPHKVVMVEVGRRYQVFKAAKLSAVGGAGAAGAAGGAGGGDDGGESTGESREGSIESSIGASREGSIDSLGVTPVWRKLDFLDLKSP